MPNHQFIGLPDGPDIRHSPGAGDPYQYVGGRLLAANDDAVARVVGWLQEQGADPKTSHVGHSDVWVVEFTEDDPEEDLVQEALRHFGPDQGVAPDYVLTFAGHANFYGRPAKPTAAPLYTSTECEAAPTVGVVDTGFIDFGTGWVQRPALPEDFPHPPPILSPDVGHGESVAWLVSRRAPRAQFIGKSVAKIWSAIPAMHGVITDSELARALFELVHQEVNIITVTVGCTAHPNYQLLATRAAVLAAHGAGILVVAAAGNDGSDDPHYPAAWPQVLGIGARAEICGEWQIASYSNRFRGIDVYAPAEYVVPYVTGSYFVPEGLCDRNVRTFMGRARVEGTSFAVPRVAGELACMWAGNPAGDPVDWAREVLRNANLDPQYFQIVEVIA